MHGRVCRQNTVVSGGFTHFSGLCRMSVALYSYFCICSKRTRLQQGCFANTYYVVRFTRDGKGNAARFHQSPLPKNTVLCTEYEYMQLARMVALCPSATKGLSRHPPSTRLTAPCVPRVEAERTKLREGMSEGADGRCCVQNAHGRNRNRQAFWQK